MKNQNQDKATAFRFCIVRMTKSEHAALLAVAEKAKRLLDDVESMARLLARHADISIQGGIIESNIIASKEALANLAAVREGKA